MMKFPRKYSSIVVFLATVAFLLPFSAQATSYKISGTTIVDQALVTTNTNITSDGIEADGGVIGDTLTIESGVTVGGVDFAGFPYELFNRGKIDGNPDSGVFCDADCIVNNDGIEAQIFGNPAGVEILMNTGSAQVFNSGKYAEIEGADTGVLIDGGGFVENSGDYAIITGGSDFGVFIQEGDGTVNNTGMKAHIIGDKNGVHMNTTNVSTSVTQIVGNSGEDSRIEGLTDDGIDLFATDSLEITQGIDNSGAGSKIIGSFGHGVDIYADGLTPGVDGTSIMQAVSNGGVDMLGEGALIEGTSGSGIAMNAFDSLSITQTVDNTSADAIVRGSLIGIDIFADGRDDNSVDGQSIVQTVNNSGMGAFIDSGTSDGIEMDAQDSLSITQLVDNSGTGASIVGDEDGIHLDADGKDNKNTDSGNMIMQTVLNSGADASIDSHTDDGLEIVANDSLEIEQLVDNSGAGASITGNKVGVNLFADGQSDGGVDGESISQTVKNSALIKGSTGGFGIDMNAFDALKITQSVDNSDSGAKVFGDEDGINLQATGMDDNSAFSDIIEQTVTNSGANARIESFGSKGINMDAMGGLDVTQLVDNTGAGAEIIADMDGINLDADSEATTVTQTVNNTGAGSIIRSQNGIGVNLNSDGAGTTQEVNNTGADALIEGEAIGVSIKNVTNDMITLTNGNDAGDGASIIATNSDGVGVAVNGNAHVFNNFNSTIMGGSNNIGSGVQFLGGDFDNLFDNRGLVSCGLACDKAVMMGEGDDTVKLRTGSDVRGDIDGEDGTDTVNLYGTGIFEHDFLNFDGSGKLNMEGEDWELNSSGTHAVAETYINSGILRVNNGILNGFIEVGSGGTLGGNGTIDGNVDVLDGGTLAPGNSIDTLTVKSQHFYEGSNLNIEFSDNLNDVVVVDDGATTIDDGSTVTFTPFGSTIVDTRTFTFIDDPDNDDALAGAGEFSTFNAPLFFTAEVDYEDECGVPNGDGDVCVTLTRSTTFGSVGDTPNRTAMGSLFDSFLGSPLPDVQALLVELDKMATFEDFNKALDQLTPEAHAIMVRLALFEKLSFISTLNGRLDIFNTQTQFASNPGVQLAMTGLDPVFLGKVLQGKTKKRKAKRSRTNRRSAKGTGGQWDAFIRPYGQFSTMDSEDGYAGFDSSSGGVTAGLKGWISNNINLGAEVGFSNLNAEFEGSDSEGDIETYHGALFAGLQSKHWRGDVVFVYSKRDFEMARRVVLGPINSLARSEHDGEEITVNVRAAYDMHLGFMVLSPEFSLNYSNLTEDEFKEKGAGVANMIIAESDSDSLRTTLGLRAAFKSRLGNGGMTIVTDAHVHWAHEFMDDSQTISAQFVGFGGGGGVNIINRPLPADSVIGGLGLLGMASENFGVSLNYDIQIGAEDFVNHTISGGAEYRF